MSSLTVNQDVTALASEIASLTATLKAARQKKQWSKIGTLAAKLQDLETRHKAAVLAASEIQEEDETLAEVVHEIARITTAVEQAYGQKKWSKVAALSGKLEKLEEKRKAMEAALNQKNQMKEKLIELDSEIARITVSLERAYDQKKWSKVGLLSEKLEQLESQKNELDLSSFKNEPKKEGVIQGETKNVSIEFIFLDFVSLPLVHFFDFFLSPLALFFFGLFY